MRGNYGKVTKKNAILYAGGLLEDNGVKILLEGFLNCRITDVELWICGEGALETLVRDYANKYSRIKYYGVVP